MGRALLGPTIDAVAGHTGTLNFWPTGGNSNVGQTPHNSGNQTPRQRASQAAWTAMVKAWNQFVTQSEKNGWDAFGTAHPTGTKCGGTASLNKFEAFARTNLTLYHIGKALRTSAPSSFVSPAPGTVTLTYGAGPPETLTLSSANAPNASQTPVIIATGPKLPGNASSAKKTTTLFIAADGTAGPWEIAADWTLRYGPIRSGVRITAGVYYVDFTSGAVSTKSTTFLIIP